RSSTSPPKRPCSAFPSSTNDWTRLDLLFLPTRLHLRQRVLDNREPEGRNCLQAPPGARHALLFLLHPVRVNGLLRERPAAVSWHELRSHDVLCQRRIAADVSL